MYLIYILTNPSTQKSYIGLTNNLKKRLAGHKRHNTVACQDFRSKVLFDNIPTRAEASEMEKVYIDLYQTFDNGYNKTRGGDRGTEISDEVCKKLSDLNKGKKLSKETRQKMSRSKKGKSTWNKGIPRSNEAKRKIGLANKGQRRTDEQKRRISESKRGHSPSIETREKISNTLKSRKARKATEGQLSLFELFGLE